MSLSCRPGNMRAHHAGVMEARAGRPGGQASRRVRGPTAHRAAGGEPPLASRGMQNSQRVLLAKPRTAPVARRRDGDIAPYRQAARGVRTATGHERCALQRGTGVEHRNGAREVRTAGAHDAKPRTAPMARRRDGDIAPYRQAARRGRTGNGAAGGTL